MKLSFELKLGQHLTITPQLQQAIRLLQLSSIELQQEIQEALETNPLLEENEEEPVNSTQDSENTLMDNQNERIADDKDAVPTDLEMEKSSPHEELSTDSDWADSYDIASAAPVRNNDGNTFPDIDARNSATETLSDHLGWQIQMTPFSERDRMIAQAISDSINDDGYLVSAFDDIQQSLDSNLEVEIDEIEAVLHQIQNFDPVGVGARDLGECLSIQLKQLASDTPYLHESQLLADKENLALLAKRDQSALRRKLKLSSESLQHAVELIQSLNPRPGASIQSSQTNYIIPDILVRKIKGIWRAELNGDVAPRLRVNPEYEKLIHRGDNSADNKYLQDQLQQARWFIKSLSSRNDTLLKVARTIVDRQRGFFNHGPEAMKPLVLHDIAEAVDMHESTISRVTTNKYMLTPRGIFELKYFFSSHVNTVDGGTCSATAIRSLIQKIIDQEPANKPISDNKIAQFLETQGIHVARRTIAKYRESLNIPPSNQRKSLF